MKLITRWLFTGKRLPRRMTLNQILDYNLRAGELKVVW